MLSWVKGGVINKTSVTAIELGIKDQVKIWQKPSSKPKRSISDHSPFKKALNSPTKQNQMSNNDILKTLRYSFDFNDFEMINLFNEGGMEVNRELVSNWLKNEEDPAYQKIIDKELAAFLNGLIILKRGKKDENPPVAEKSLNNNMILRKLKIALSMKDTDMLEVFELRKFRISKHELSAFFRKPDQHQYRECKDQILRNFLMGLQLKLRG